MEATHAPRLALSIDLPIRWGDMDAFGHVNNTVYFRYMEQVRIEWMESLASDWTDTGPVIADATCRFRKPLVYPGTVRISMFIGAAGRSSLPTSYEIRRVDDGELYADGHSRLVWVSQTTGKPVPLPDALRDAAAPTGETS